MPIFSGYLYCTKDVGQLGARRLDGPSCAAMSTLLHGLSGPMKGVGVNQVFRPDWEKNC